jgi:ABC-2 type transport system permease protein
MSVAEAEVTDSPVRVLPTARPHRRVSTRLVRSELGMVFRRRRNQLAILVLTGVPVLIGVALKLSSGGSDGGPPFFDDITNNGVFVAFAALTVIIPLFLPLTVAVTAGDAVAGEAQLGTLRYLLTVPVGRTRLLLVKYAGVVAFCFAATLVVATTGAVLGLILFPSGSATLLSGSQVSTVDTLGRLFMVACYVGVMMAGLGAIGLFVSTLTEVPVAAMTATATLAVVSEVLDALPQVGSIHPYLFSHYWLSFGDLMRSPIDWGSINHGLLVTAVYIAVFGSLAWARFSGRDVSS